MDNLNFRSLVTSGGCQTVQGLQCDLGNSRFFIGFKMQKNVKWLLADSGDRSILIKERKVSNYVNYTFM